MNVKSIYNRFYPAIWAGSVLLTGFVAMFLWWTLGDGYPEPGFYYYKAATYGDSIGLTLLVYSCGMYCKLSLADNLTMEKKEKFVRLLPTLLAVVVGIFFLLWQIEWLVNADPNWTLIRREAPINVLGIKMKNRFNGAGYWHAAFFVFASSVITYFFVRAMCIRVTISDKKRKENNLCFMLSLISFAGNFYVSMISNDNIGGNMCSLIPMVCLGMTSFLAFIIIIVPFRGKRINRIKELRAIFIGGVTSAIMALLILQLF